MSCPGHGGPEHATTETAAGSCLDPPKAVRKGESPGAPFKYIKDGSYITD
ncbi:hypothetical protein [Streptomyces viridochromogenes]|nr:hypothetical protein [Streptomyces viridochromogenes]